MGMAHVHAQGVAAPERFVAEGSSTGCSGWFDRDLRRSLRRLESGQRTPS